MLPSLLCCVQSFLLYQVHALYSVLCSYTPAPSHLHVTSAAHAGLHTTHIHTHRHPAWAHDDQQVRPHISDIKHQDKRP